MTSPRRPKFRNPWVVDDVEPRTAAVSMGELEGAEEHLSGGEAYDPTTGAILAEPKADLRVPSYGGITVTGAATPTEALLKILDVLVTHSAALDPFLVDYEVLVAKLPRVPSQGFYLVRPDRWALSVPSATTREQALLQLTQALLAISRSKHRALLQNAKITPYRQ